MIKPLTLLQKAAGIILTTRLKGRQTSGHVRQDRQYGMQTGMDPGLEDMLTLKLADATSTTIYIFGQIDGERRVAVFEEWAIDCNGVGGGDLQKAMAIRALLTVAGALPEMLSGCHFSIDQAPPGSIALGESVGRGGQEQDPFSVAHLDIGRVRYRTEAVAPCDCQSPDIPIRLREAIAKERAGAAPNSFESVKMADAIEQGRDKDRSSSSELTSFLRRLERRPSLPGLYNDHWLMDFGEGGWAAIVALYHKHSSTIIPVLKEPTADNDAKQDNNRDDDDDGERYPCI